MKAIFYTLLAAALVVGAPADAKSRHGKHHGPANVSGKFDYYVMTLSWSPTFCETHPDNGQCAKHLGFVLHGLWPQYASGGYPQHCATSERLSDEARTLGAQVFPTEDLMVHEWQTHGTCNGSSSLDYFKAAQTSFGSVKVPPPLEAGTHKANLSGTDILKLIRDANPAITGRSVVATCGQGELVDVRVCLSKDLKPMACGRQVNDSCGTRVVAVPGAQ